MLVHGQLTAGDLGFTRLLDQIGAYRACEAFIVDLRRRSGALFAAVLVPAAAVPCSEIDQTVQVAADNLEVYILPYA